MSIAGFPGSIPGSRTNQEPHKKCMDRGDRSSHQQLFTVIENPAPDGEAQAAGSFFWKLAILKENIYIILQLHRPVCPNISEIHDVFFSAYIPIAYTVPLIHLTHSIPTPHQN